MISAQLTNDSWKTWQICTTIIQEFKHDNIHQTEPTFHLCHFRIFKMQLRSNIELTFRYFSSSYCLLILRFFSFNRDMQYVHYRYSEDDTFIFCTSCKKTWRKTKQKTFWMYEDFNFIVLRGIMNKMHEVCLYKRFNFEFIVFINLRENYFFFFTLNVCNSLVLLVGTLYNRMLMSTNLSPSHDTKINV